MNNLGQDKGMLSFFSSCFMTNYRMTNEMTGYF